MPYIVLDPSTAAAAPTTTAGTPLTSIGETLATFQSELLADLGNRNDVSTTRQTRWINWAYLNVSQMLNVNELNASVALSLVLNQPFYLIPTAVSWIKTMGIQDSVTWPDTLGIEMTQIDALTYRDLPDSSLFSDIQSRAWFRYGRMVVVYPTPDAAATAVMDFRVRPQPLVNSTDSPILPQEFHEAILLMAKHRAWRDLRNRVDAKIAYDDALTIIRPLLNTDAEEKDSMHMTAQPVRTAYDLYRGRF